MEIFEARNI